MKKVLIVSPHFPPANAPDMHRVRMSLPYYPEFGWSPTVLTVRPEDQDAPLDADLLKTIPCDVPITRVGGLSARVTRPVGISNVGIRAMAQLYRAGARLIRSDQIDLVYFSTTVFTTLALGRLWKHRFGVPYVIDMQDPWFTTYYDDKPRSERPPKHSIAREVHRRLERWTMRGVDSLIAVSSVYTDSLRARYPWITPDMCTTIPFGASEHDFAIAGDGPAAARSSSLESGPIRGVYVGRGGPDMATAARILCRALQTGRATSARLARISLSFTGTDYAVDGRARKSIEPVAAAEGVGDRISEETARTPYLETLRALRRADFLVLIGSDDPQYSASKVYPYILARRPIVAVVHEKSPIVELLRRARAGTVVTFANREDVDGPARRLATAWADLVAGLPSALDIDWQAFEPYTARAVTARQCLVFDSAVRPKGVPIPCTE